MSLPVFSRILLLALLFAPPVGAGTQTGKYETTPSGRAGNQPSSAGSTLGSPQFQDVKLIPHISATLSPSPGPPTLTPTPLAESALVAPKPTPAAGITSAADAGKAPAPFARNPSPSSAVSEPREEVGERLSGGLAAKPSSDENASADGAFFDGRGLAGDEWDAAARARILRLLRGHEKIRVFVNDAPG